MKQFALLFFFISLIACKSKQKESVLTNQKTIQDYANLFSDEEEDSLANFILKYEKLTTNEICIVTMDSLPKDVEILYYATNLANDLKIGKKESNNGLLLLIDFKNKQVAFSTGYGTEKILTDRVCKHLINSTLIPNFKTNNYYTGVRNVLDSIQFKWR